MAFRPAPIYTGWPAEYDKVMQRLLPMIAAIVFLLTSVSFGQAPVPKDKQAPADNSWKTPAAAVLFAGFVLAVSIKNSKREHLD